MQIQVGDLNVNCTIDGAGPPLVLAHGGGADLIYWGEMIAGLAAHFTVYAYYLCDFGKTERPDSPTLGLARWTEDLLGFLNAMRLDAPILVDRSLGGCMRLDLLFPSLGIPSAEPPRD